MKSKSIGSLILLAVLAPSCGGSGGGSAPPKFPNFIKWQTQQRTPTSSDLRTVVFADANHGIVGGKDGSFFRTDNGGITWTQQEISPPNRTGDVIAMSAQGTTLVAVGTDAANGKGRMWQGTHDSFSWVTVDAAPTTAPYTDVNVSDPGGGNVPGTYWMLRTDGNVDYSFGSSSGTFPTGPPLGGIPAIAWTQANGILFIGMGGYGLICGQDTGYAGDAGDPTAVPPIPPTAARGPGAQIIRTNDYGNTWNIQTMPNTLNGGGQVINTVSTLRRIYSTHTTTLVTRAYACGDDTQATPHGCLAVTNLNKTDAWDLVGGTGVPATAPSFRALSFPENDLTGWVVGDGGTIYKITAVAVYTPPVAGPPPVPGFWTYTYTWTLQSVGGVIEDLYSIAMIDNNNGFIVGDKGTVLKMSAGGPWTKISKGDAGITFNAASFTDDGMKGIAVGDTGKIYRTIDGGTNWTSLTSGTGENLLGAAVPRTGTGTTAYVCGANGTLLRSTDVWTLGNWGAVTGTTAGDTYRAILFPQDELKGVCAGTANGGGPRLLRTSDGTTWAAPTTGPTAPSASFNALSANFTGSVIYASGGANGPVALSGDGANGWDLWSDLVPAPGGALTLGGIASPEGATYRAFASASDNLIYRLTTMAPQTWSATPNPWGAQTAVGLAFQGDQNGLTVLGNGQMYYTIDGAATWLRSYAHTKDQPRGLWMSPTILGLGYIVATDGTILKTLSGGH